MTIADVLETGSAEKPPLLLADSVEKIPNDAAATAPDNLRRLIYFASLAAQKQGKTPFGTQSAWTDYHSPVNADKCRRLGK